MTADNWMETLRCPATGQPLRPADAETVHRANAALPDAPATEGLITEDGSRFYPVRDGIPVLLTTEAVPLAPN